MGFPIKFSSAENYEMLLYQEEVAPSLSVLWSVSKMHRHTRKYLKNIVLPPLTARDIQVGVSMHALCPGCLSVLLPSLYLLAEINGFSVISAEE